MQDVFDNEFEKELASAYTVKLWSELDDNLKMKMIKSLKNGLIACHQEVPSDSEMLKRLKGFYACRRNSQLTREKRKMETKASHRTWVSMVRSV